MSSEQQTVSCPASPASPAVSPVSQAPRAKRWWQPLQVVRDDQTGGWTCEECEPSAPSTPGSLVLQLTDPVEWDLDSL